MITELPYVKCVRFCERKDRNGNILNVMVVDTNISIPKRLNSVKDKKIYTLVQEIKEYQALTRYSLNPHERIDKTEIRGKAI